MELLVLYAIVAIVGYYIMSEPSLGNGCFSWCDVGKGMFGLALANLLTISIKGPVPSVRIMKWDKDKPKKGPNINAS